MYAKINNESFPPNVLSTISQQLGGGVRISGEATNEQDRMDVATVLAPIHKGDIIEFDVEDSKPVRLHGPGKIMELEIEEQGIGPLVRIKFYIMIQYITDQEVEFRTKIV